MKFFITIFALLFIFSCGEKNKNFDGSVKNYTPIRKDTNCINPWANAYFELNNKTFDTLTLAIKTKLSSILGSKVFDEMQARIMSDSIKNAVFNTGSTFTSGDIKIDTTNLLRLDSKADVGYYLNDKMSPRKAADWKSIFTQFDQFTYQETLGFEIGYTITPCIKKVLRQEG